MDTLLSELRTTAVAAVSADVAVRNLTDSDEFDHQLCRRLSRECSLPRSHGRWPRSLLGDQPDPRAETLVGLVDGLVVGRAVLEAPYLPYAELVNLCVRPDYRRRGVGGAIVQAALHRAVALGCKYLMVQEYRDAPMAHGIYHRAGFVDATLGEFRRLICLLDAPLVRLFRMAYPDAEHRSQPLQERGERWWRLSWHANGQSVALDLHGGSCQFDSDGYQPVVQSCELRTAEVAFAAQLAAPPRARRGETIELALDIEAFGAPFAGVVRAMLLPDTSVPGAVGLQASEVALAPGERATVPIPVRVAHEFRCDGQRFVSYPSAPFTVEVAWLGGSALLSAAVIVE